MEEAELKSYTEQLEKVRSLRMRRDIQETAIEKKKEEFEESIKADRESLRTILTALDTEDSLFRSLAQTIFERTQEKHLPFKVEIKEITKYEITNETDALVWCKENAKMFIRESVDKAGLIKAVAKSPPAFVKVTKRVQVNIPTEIETGGVPQ